jgi:uncharacterized glyoxalase superfamily protein PhnB
MNTEPNANCMHTVSPHLVCDGAAAALDFYTRAFGAVELTRLTAPDGKLIHAGMRIGDSIVMLVDEIPTMHCFGPKTLKGTPVTIHLQVPNVDELFAQAIAAGAMCVMSPADMFWGDRYGVLVDPFGHKWSIATHQRDLTPEQIQKAAAGIFSEGCGSKK